MALLAGDGRVRAGQREPSGVVIEFSPEPLRGGVAELAVLREAGRGVIGMGGGSVFLEVAGRTIRAERRVLAIGVAQSASRRGVRAGQRKLGGAVIELRPEPLRGGVASLAVLRESGGDVVRILGGLIIPEMAGGAGYVQAGVDATRMALQTGNRRVGSGKRELGHGSVIEGCAQPLCGVVAGGAGLWESRGGVVGILGGLVVLQMTGNAIGADGGEVAVGMALQAGDGGVRSGERELGHVVIEGGSLPGCGVVAGRAIAGESRRHVIRAGGLGEVGEVATGALGLDALKTVARVAGFAFQTLVRARESGTGKASVIEARDLPSIGSVTGFAGRGESGGAVIEDAILLKIAGVATDALSAESDVAPDRRAGVTGIALKRGMGAEERETIPVILDGAGIYTPSEDGMAAFALSAELALVEIGVAIRTARAGLGKDFRDMARITRHVLVHAA